ncbi:hypothetical protein C8R46DRAFT_861993, partial [Mycena filopes]
KESPDEALDALWGPIMVQSPSVYVYVEGLRSKTSHGGAGIFFGPSSSLNLALTVPAGSTDTVTADRARVFAIHEVLLRSPSTAALVIFCSSQLVIRQICYAAAKNLNLGWPGADSDIFKDTVKLLSLRPARTCFVYLDWKTQNNSRKNAHSLAKQG